MGSPTRRQLLNEESPQQIFYNQGRFSLADESQVKINDSSCNVSQSQEQYDDHEVGVVDNQEHMTIQKHGILSQDTLPMKIPLLITRKHHQAIEQEQEGAPHRTPVANEKPKHEDKAATKPASKIEKVAKIQQHTDNTTDKFFVSQESFAKQASLVRNNGKAVATLSQRS